ncbi:MAG: DUF4124 domain-containing protein [Rhodanobacteraceae bacterium]
MDHPIEIRGTSIRYRAWLARAACAVLLGWIAVGAHAASIYRCVGSHGEASFRDTPCTTHAHQRKLDVTGQPLIDPAAPRQASKPREAKPAARSRARRAPTATRKRKTPMSWECRAADGEVFYRHARCPGSIAGDGVVRWQDGAATSGKRSRRRRGAWGAVRVHGMKIPRSEACRRIHSAGAAGRDGHQRDASVSTYDHLMGRDPCVGG